MLTIAVYILGIRAINWHTSLPFSWPGGLDPIEFQPSFSMVRLDIKVGPDSAVVPAPGSRAITAVPAGTITHEAPHPAIQAYTPVSPAPGDTDYVDPLSAAAPPSATDEDFGDSTTPVVTVDTHAVTTQPAQITWAGQGGVPVDANGLPVQQ